MFWNNFQTSRSIVDVKQVTCQREPKWTGSLQTFTFACNLFLWISQGKKLQANKSPQKLGSVVFNCWERNSEINPLFESMLKQTASLRSSKKSFFLFFIICVHAKQQLLDLVWASSWDYGTYHIADLRRLGWACACAQSRHSLCCSQT